MSACRGKLLKRKIKNVKARRDIKRKRAKRSQHQVYDKHHLKALSIGFEKSDIKSVMIAIMYLDKETAYSSIEKIIKNKVPYHLNGSRKNRDEFYCSMIKRLRKTRFKEISRFMYKCIVIIQQAESMFDCIKSTLQECAIGEHSDVEQCWSHIKRAESEFSWLSARIKEYIQKATEEGVFQSEVVLISDDGKPYSPDALTDLISCSLTLSLKMICYKNKWFNNEEIKIPEKIKVSEEQVFQAGSTQMFAASWNKLEEQLNLTIKFGGKLSEIPKQHLDSSVINAGISTPYIFNRTITNSEKYDYLANERLTRKLHQNSMEIFDDELENYHVVDALREIDNINDNRFVTQEELPTIIAISEILFIDIMNDTVEYNGLTLREWIRLYSILIFISIEHMKENDEGMIVTDAEFRQILCDGGIDNSKIDSCLSNALFSKISRDLYDTPVIRIGDGSYYICTYLLKNLVMTRTILSNLSMLKMDFHKKGTGFEEFVVNFIKEKNLNCKSFKFKRKSDEYEYDAVFIINNKVFVIECKNTSLSGYNPIQSYRYDEFINKTKTQVNRLVSGLKKYPEVFLEHFGHDINDFELVPVIMNCLPYAKQGRDEGVYVTDCSSFCKFFRKTINFKVITKEKKFQEKEIKKMWDGEAPTSKDLIRHLDSHVQIEFISNHLEVKTEWYPTGNYSAFLATHAALNLTSLAQGNVNTMRDIEM